MPTPPTRGDDAKLLDELGDVLFQVHFLALLLEERGAGDLAAVADHCIEKLIRRHPHVFGDVEVDGAEAVRRNWEEIKRTSGGPRRRRACSPTCRRTCRRSRSRRACSGGRARPERARSLARPRRRSRARRGRGPRGALRRARRAAVRARALRAGARRRPRARAARGATVRYREASTPSRRAGGTVAPPGRSIAAERERGAMAAAAQGQEARAGTRALGPRQPDRDAVRARRAALPGDQPGPLAHLRPARSRRSTPQLPRSSSVTPRARRRPSTRCSAATSDAEARNLGLVRPGEHEFVVSGLPDN